MFPPLDAIKGDRGVRDQNTWWAYFVEAIVVVSMLFTECPNYGSEDMTNSILEGLGFYVGIKRVIFGDFFTIFPI